MGLESLKDFGYVGSSYRSRLAQRLSPFRFKKILFVAHDPASSFYSNQKACNTRILSANGPSPCSAYEHCLPYPRSYSWELYWASPSRDFTTGECVLADAPPNSPPQSPLPQNLKTALDISSELDTGDWESLYTYQPGDITVILDCFSWCFCHRSRTSPQRTTTPAVTSASCFRVLVMQKLVQCSCAYARVSSRRVHHLVSISSSYCIPAPQAAARHSNGLRARLPRG